MERIIYTCIIGGYDRVRPAPEEDGWKAVLFTDQQLQDPMGWDVRSIPKFINDDPAMTARWYKTHPGFLFGCADTIWIDGRITLRKKPSEIWAMKGDNKIAVLTPQRYCAYEEAEVCKLRKLDDTEKIDKQIRKYYSEGFPMKFGGSGTGLLLRDGSTWMFSETWWQEIKSGSVRDQISFPYVAWKKGIEYTYLPLSIIDLGVHRRERKR